MGRKETALGCASIAAALALCAGLEGREARAQAISHFALRGEFGAGLMLTDVQRTQLGYDTAHLQATGRLGVDPIDWLSIQLSVNNGFFFARPGLEMGRVLAFQGGLRLQPAAGRVGRF